MTTASRVPGCPGALRVALLALLPALMTASLVEARVEPAPDPAAEPAPRLVVKLRPDGAPYTAPARIARLSAATGVPLGYVRTLAMGAHLVSSPLVADGAGAEVVAARLADDASVEYAERTRRLRAARVPSDLLFGQQFYLQSTPTALHAPQAWDVTTGSAAIVVAVLDTGYTEHVDLVGRLLPGYDFVAPAHLSNDGSPLNAQGNHRDADARDPGDWVSIEDLAGPLGATECQVRASSWHGTSVIGAIAAATDNGDYVAGVDWKARVLPVRVLGKCYGEDPDTADAIMWAAGVPVPGIPPNPSPAHVINLSLGDPGACPRFMQEAVTAALAHGVTRAIVAAAGNQNSGGDHFPSSCEGVLSVAATLASGSRATYSNYGPRIDLAAPGGGGSSGFLTLIDLGPTTPVADSASFRSGTSFAAPLVSGTVALMLAVAPGLSAAQVRDLVKATTQPFPAGSTCTTATCGTGILDANAAVRAAQATTGGHARVLLVEYYNAALDHYFLTWKDDEIVRLDEAVTLKGWQRTGLAIEALRDATARASPVCRIYIPPGQGDSHFFGRDGSECAGTLAAHPGFVAEDATFFHLYVADGGTCGAGTRPVYRVFSNRADANHRYTTDRAVRDAMLARGWLAEGDGPDRVVMCAPAPGAS